MSRFTTHAEEGAVHKVTAEIKVALVYPNTYYIAMSNLGWQLVYRLINSRDDTLAERFCLPDKTEPLRSLESHLPLNQFDIVAFSLSYEMDYLHILKLLKLGGIAPEKSKRTPADPLIIVGGVCAFMNPEPLADFIDIFVLGEAEGVLNEFLDAYKTGRQTAEDKTALLRQLAQIPGIYVPQFYQVSYSPEGRIAQVLPDAGVPCPLQIQSAGDLNELEGASQIFTKDTEFGDTCLVELSRGCVHNCFFCLLGALYQPYRKRTPAAISAMIEHAEQMGKKVGLLGAAATDYPHLTEICRQLVQRSIPFSISSLRADCLTEDLLNSLYQNGQRTITLAPEAGSQRLRNLINKRISDEELYKAVEMAAEVGFLNLKLYFMIGLPTETTEDLTAIVETALRAKTIVLKYARPRGKMGDIILSLSCFVPKPHTPFQWLPMEKEKVLKDKLAFIKKSLSREGNIKLIGESPRQAIIQGLLARGDRRLGQLLLTAYNLEENWPQAIKSVNIDLDFYQHRPRSTDEILPWQHLQSPGMQDRLLRQFSKFITLLPPVAQASSL